MPKFVISDYDGNIKTFERILANNSSLPVSEVIGMASLATEVPILVVAHCFGNMLGYTPEIKEKIKGLEAYYVTYEIIGAKE